MGESAGAGRCADFTPDFHDRWEPRRVRFQRVPVPQNDPPRLHLDLRGGPRQAEEVERLLGLGARRLDIGQAMCHPSMGGPLLELCPQPAPKGAAKNRLHVDIRLETGDDPDGVAASITERGGRELHPEWGELPWRIYADPSGKEFCVLPARS
ncbi:MAG TPA: VOC family protein [Actinomycetales bacterium]|nr:VOC family protein [Actinomycetales bacterium]